MLWFYRVLLYVPDYFLAGNSDFLESLLVARQHLRKSLLQAAESVLAVSPCFQSLC